MGSSREEEAFCWLRFKTGEDWAGVGFCADDDHTMGCSPDLVIVEDGQVVKGCEAKCKTLPNHVAIIESQQMPSEHKPQVHGSMVVTGLKEWGFMSYHPGCREQFYTTIEWDDYTNQLLNHLSRFIDELGKLKAKYMREVA